MVQNSQVGLQLGGDEEVLKLLRCEDIVFEDISIQSACLWLSTALPHTYRA